MSEISQKVILINISTPSSVGTDNNDILLYPSDLVVGLYVWTVDPLRVYED
ncbi:hypothetical protein TUM4261_22400 [Shewanella sp. c952]|nr:hypothetical protein TUM4261_22400 [Shewanella sp. c952]